MDSVNVVQAVLAVAWSVGLGASVGPVIPERTLHALAAANGPLARVWGEVARTFGWLAAKTGLPSLLLVAAALVVALRLARRVGRIVVEFALAIVLLLALRKMGWVGW